MKNILKFIPGFRSGKIWKMVVASIYYLMAFSMLTNGIGVFLGVISMPFFFLGIASAVVKKNTKYLPTAIFGFIIMVIGISVTPAVDTSQEIASTTTPTIIASPTPSPTPTATPEPTPTDTPEPTPEPVLEPDLNNDTSSGISGYTDSDASDQYRSYENSASTASVWIGDSGNKYHTYNCRTLKGNKYEITLSEAQAQGREACKVCNP